MHTQILYILDGYMNSKIYYIIQVKFVY